MYSCLWRIVGGSGTIIPAPHFGEPEEPIMPFADNNGVRIHYQLQGKGPAILLQHGMAGSWQDWEDMGYTQVLAREHQLILVDARGHGESDKPHQPSAYDLRLLVADLTAVLDSLGIRQAHYVGYSMGGWIGFGAAQHAPDRFCSLVLGGAHPYAESMQLARTGMSLPAAERLANFEKMVGPHLTPELRTRWQANDVTALAAMAQDRGSLEDVLPGMRMPCLLFAGDSDPRHAKVEQCARAIRHATFFSLPGCGHIAALARSDLVLPHLRSFLAERVAA
jgi:pimeloyl-ACP methyl ester carboxylesterase